VDEDDEHASLFRSRPQIGAGELRELASSHSGRDRTPRSLVLVGSPMCRQRGPQPWGG